MKNWKTTLAGILSTFVAISAAGFFAPNPYINTKVSGILLFISGIARVVLGTMQKDAQPTPTPTPVTPVAAPAVPVPPVQGK